MNEKEYKDLLKSYSEESVTMLFTSWMIDFHPEVVFKYMPHYLVHKRQRWMVVNKMFWMAKQYPEIMAECNSSFMINERRTWMAKHRPEILCERRPDFISDYNPEEMVKYRLGWMIKWKTEWMEEHHPELMGKTTSETQTPELNLFCVDYSSSIPPREI